MSDQTVASSKKLPVYSMTGFATVRVDSEEHAGFTLTLKGVNHRFLDLQLRLPLHSEALEGVIRKMLKEQINRGHVEFVLQLDRPARSAIRLNEELLAAYIVAFRDAADAHGLACEPDLNEILRLPGMMGGQSTAGREDAANAESVALEGTVRAALPDLIARFNQSRMEEGEVLAEELRSSMQRLDALAEQASTLREGVRTASFERLRTRIAELTQGLALGDDRLLAEAALLADRSDIEEELVRLRTHSASFVAMLDQGGPLGKRLDFLLQELNREANTLLSKTGGASSQNGLRITEIGLEMKVEIERAREQIQNIE